MLFFYRERFCRSACKDWLKTNVVIFLGWCDLRPDVSEKKISWITMRCRRICDKDIPFSTLTEHVFDFIFSFVCLWFIWLLSNSSIHLRAKWIKPLICRQMTFLSFSQDKKIEKVKEKNKSKTFCTFCVKILDSKRFLRSKQPLQRQNVIEEISQKRIVHRNGFLG